LTYWADGERDRLRALVEGERWQSEGNTAASPAAEDGETTVPLDAESPAGAGLS
jgi:hypothetical protein